jgi:hypothetical protein
VITKECGDVGVQIGRAGEQVQLAVQAYADDVIFISDSPEGVLRTHMLRIGHTLKSFRWIPHALTSELKQVCFDLCLQLLPKLRAHAYDNWRHPVAGNES